MPEGTYQHVARARSARGVLALAATWGCALFLLLGLGALPFITLLLFVAGIPLAYDLIRDRQSQFEISPKPSAGRFRMPAVRSRWRPSCRHI